MKNGKTIKSDPFAFESNGTEESGTRKLDLTPELIGLSNTRATELMRTVSKTPELHELANKILDDAQTQSIIDLIHQVFDEETMKQDAEFLKGANENILSRLLESRRSDRSKAKSKGPRKSVQIAQTLFSAMYAELLVRMAGNKPYQTTKTELDYDELKADQDALNRKIRSLQSKQSRLRKTAEFIDADAKALEVVQDEIDRLKSLRVGVPNVSSKTIIKSADAETLRKALELVDTNKLSQDEQEKIQAMMAKLG